MGTFPLFVWMCHWQRVVQRSVRLQRGSRGSIWPAPRTSPSSGQVVNRFNKQAKADSAFYAIVVEVTRRNEITSILLRRLTRMAWSCSPSNHCNILRCNFNYTNSNAIVHISTDHMIFLPLIITKLKRLSNNFKTSPMVLFIYGHHHNSNQCCIRGTH